MHGSSGRHVTYHITAGDQKALQLEIEALSKTFRFIDPKIEWFYHNEIVSLECRITEESRILSITLEPGEFLYDNSEHSLASFYSQIRTKEQKRKGNQKGNF